MSIVFGRDRIPEPWAASERPPCAEDQHLLDTIGLCTECGWLAPLIRCSVQGCIVPAEYEGQVAAKDDPTFANIIRSAPFCQPHALLGGLSLVPQDGPAS